MPDKQVIGFSQGATVPSGLYALYNPENALSSLVGMAKQGAVPSQPAGVRAQVLLNVAVLPISGVLFKCGWFAPGVDDLHREFSRLASMDGIDAIVLDIYSPGGEVSGINEFARTIFEARSRKRIVAYCDDLTCSAAYHLASQAHVIVANETAIVGSVGVFKLAIDSSGSLEKAGVKVHLVSTGFYKGVGVPGTPIKEEHLKHEQTLVDTVFESMLRGIARGRGVSVEVVRSKMGDGRVYVVDRNSDAVKLGFIDKIGSFDDALAEAGESRGGNTKGTDAGAETRSKMSEAKAAQERLQQVEGDLRATRAKAFTDMVYEVQGRNPGMSRMKASVIVAKRNPELHRAFLEHTNPGKAI